MGRREVSQLRLTADLFEKVRGYLLRDDRERICFLFGNLVETDGEPRVVVSRMLGFSDECYLRQESVAAVLGPEAKNHVYHEFCRTGADTLINCHSHPFTRRRVRFSAVDDEDDRRESSYLYEQVPGVRVEEGFSDEILALSLVFGQESVDARTLNGAGEFGRVKELVVAGDSIERHVPTSEAPSWLEEPAAPGAVTELYDRQRTLLGEKLQDRLASVQVGVVGAGGVGSVLAEGLARVGFRRLILVDGDRLEESNLNRWLGGRKEDVGQPKVEVAARRLTEMLPEMTVEAVDSNVYSARAVAALRRTDLLLGAIDDHVVRYFLNRFSLQYLIPYLDGATRIYRDPEGPMRFASRVASVLPGTSACLNCSQILYLDRKEIAHALYDPATRAQLRSSGYLEYAPSEAELSIFPLNSCLASLLLMEILNLFSGWRPTVRTLSFDWNAEESICGRGDAENFPERPRTGCLDCHGYLALGDSEALPIPRGFDEVAHG